MKRHSFQIKNVTDENLKQRLLWGCAESFYASFLDSNGHRGKYSKYLWLAALGHSKVFLPLRKPFEEFRLFLTENPDWLFGHLNYDLKNDLEELTTQHHDQLTFPRLSFFVPETVVYNKEGEIWAESLTCQTEEAFLDTLPDELDRCATNVNLQLQPKTSREEYLNKVASLKEHLQRGNIYEVNYCIEFATKAESFRPLPAFYILNDSSKAPFAAFYKHNDQYLLCASPERYLQKTGQRIISQPIKGTAKRSANHEEDEALKNELYHSEKERSENVMITDLVRNDLSRTAADGSVKVEELFGIYSFNTVHQMITTISSKLDEKYGIAELLETTFPMGSMTGAPKVRATKLIDEHENFARGLYSGAVGYISPSGDFDFNVVIRGLLYNGKTSYLSARVGSAITIHCDAEKEYEECLLKAENLFRALRTS